MYIVLRINEYQMRGTSRSKTYDGEMRDGSWQRRRSIPERGRCESKSHGRGLCGSFVRRRATADPRVMIWQERKLQSLQLWCVRLASFARRPSRPKS